jgi:hypothetical protein
MKKAISVISIIVLFTLHAFAQGEGPDNYSFFKLYVTNDQQELLLVKWNNEWELVGAKYNYGVSVRVFIDTIALSMGIKVKDAKLAALYTQRPVARTNPTLMHYYTVKYDGGKIKVPAGCTDIKWFSYAEAMKVIPYEIMKSVMVKIKEHPGKVLGAAFETAKDPQTNETKVTVLENFYFLN